MTRTSAAIIFPMNVVQTPIGRASQKSERLPSRSRPSISAPISSPPAARKKPAKKIDVSEISVKRFPSSTSHAVSSSRTAVTAPVTGISARTLISRPITCSSALIVLPPATRPQR